MSVEAFVDTNILLYAHTGTARRKREVAANLLGRLWEDRSGSVSTQVLQELYVNLRRKVKPPLVAPAARELVEQYLAWRVVVNDASSVIRAAEIEERYQISFWDALIVDAAIASGASVLWTEDLNHGQRFGSRTRAGIAAACSATEARRNGESFTAPPPVCVPRGPRGRPCRVRCVGFPRPPRCSVEPCGPRAGSCTTPRRRRRRAIRDRPR